MTCDSLPRSRATRPRRWRGWTVVLALAVCGAASAGAAEEPVTIYQWTDSEWIYRYTPDFDRIPEYARDTAVTIQASDEPLQRIPLYFEPDPRSSVIAIPSPPAEPPAETGTGGAVPGAQRGSLFSEFDARISELELRIAEYEEALKELIDAEGTDADAEASPELREIAARLPRLQHELASLKRGRASLGGF